MHVSSADINECDPQDEASKFTYSPENCEQICINVPGITERHRTLKHFLHKYLMPVCRSDQTN